MRSYLLCSREVNVWGLPNLADFLSEALWDYEALINVQLWVDHL